MKEPSIAEMQAVASEIATHLPDIKMLVLFGSRATGNVHPGSDWDFAVLYDRELLRARMKNYWYWLEIDRLLTQMLPSIPMAKIDVAELNHCSPLLGYQVASEGKLLYEKHPGEFIKFQCLAAKIYADTAKFREAQWEALKLALQRWEV